MYCMPTSSVRKKEKCADGGQKRKGEQIRKNKGMEVRSGECSTIRIIKE